jgi:hydrogenase maturation protein HypF
VVPNPIPAEPAQRGRLKLTIRGAVQGVGFRPFIFRLANELQLQGWVNNSPQGVFIETEGSRPKLESFLLRLEKEKPERSFIQSLEASWLDPVGYSGFEIRQSETAGAKTALVLPDIATCPECVREIFDSANRRYRYPFTNCTNCGPRFSILEALPYDRAHTSMKKFVMCPQCQTEYEDPANRRFHAQPNACPVCGPHLQLWDRLGHPVSNPGDDSLRTAADAICRGKIVAVKGLGGFHLIVAAHDDAAVQRLRELKHREEKPFALMFPSLGAVKSVCEVSPFEERLLLSPESPIVLLHRLLATRHSPLATSVCPANPNLGVMLPYTPLHHLLLSLLDFPIVATSGNLSDEPICIDEREALDRLGGIADLFLVHNRPIVRHVDDSIVRMLAGRESVLRRARGYAPLPVQLKAANAAPDTPVLTQSILAVGAHLKNTIGLSVGSQAFISQHIGDLETDQAYSAFRKVIADFQTLYETRPDLIVADMHPDYLSTKVAQELSVASGVSPDVEGGVPPPGTRHSQFRGLTPPGKMPGSTAGETHAATLQGAFIGWEPLINFGSFLSVQHHFAHVLACMAENELELPLLGVSWDGTGYGLDHTIWGGEFFVVTHQSSKRVAHLRLFPLPGGEKAIKEPRRAALGLLYALLGDETFERKDLAPIAGFSTAELSSLKTMLARQLNSPLTSSIGRLFDAVSALVGLRQLTRFEGQAAMELEFALAGVETDDAYQVLSGEWRVASGEEGVASGEEEGPRKKGRGVSESDGIGSKRRPESESLLATRHSPLATALDWSPLLLAILEDLSRRVPVAEISARFHNALAESIVTVARHFKQERVILSGGCFQNRYLTERAIRRLRAEGFRPYWHQRIPPNDGGIALGQLAAAKLVR